MSEPSTITHKEFLERALVSAGEWSRFADPKLLAVLVFLGLGLSDLVDHAGQLLNPHEAASASCTSAIDGHTCWGIASTTTTITALIVAIVTVLLVTHGLFPRLSMRGLLPGDHDKSPITSVYFFGDVARYGSQQAYRVAVMTKNEADLLDDIAGQIYEVSSVAVTKHRASRRAFIAVIGFLVFWAIARVSSDLAGGLT